MDNKTVPIEDEFTNAHHIIPRNYIFPFILLASCFMWWGIANNLTDPLVRVFIEIFEGLTNFQASLIQFGFYGGYFCLAIPGAIIARKYSYKTGVLVGLGFYILGCLLLFPASIARQFVFFILAYYVLASGLSILETSANPYILSLGSEKTATQRLNFAQAFNPLGSIIGVMLAQMLVMAKLPTVDNQIVVTAETQSEALRIVIFPYLAIAAILIAVWVLILITKMPTASDPDNKVHFLTTFGRLFRNTNYLFAVIAQFFYVGVQISAWTYTNFYIPDQLSVSQEVALRYHTVALVLFGLFRFVATWLMKWIRPSTLLLYASLIALVLTFNVIVIRGLIGVYSLVGISACMSLMFPTIFGLGSKGLGSDRKVGSSGLIMAILGGALLTPLQGAMIDWTNVSVSYIVPFVCFIVVAAFAFYSGRVKVIDDKVVEGAFEAQG